MNCRRLVTLVLLMPAFAKGAPPELLEQRSPRLPDYSYAGYHHGEVALPNVPVATRVTDHGAKGDGTTDDAPAILKAIASLGPSGGAVLLPAGRYVLGSPVVINRSNVVLRGDGPGRTVLVVPKSLQQLAPKGFSEGAKLSYSFGGAFIHVKGRDEGKKIADVVAAAPRGSRELLLSGAAGGIKAGDVVRLRMNNAASLGRHLHGDARDAGEATFVHKSFVDFSARVAAVDGARVTLDRALRTDVRPGEWAPELWGSRPTVREVGIESLSFEFPGVPKQKHLQEEGFNAIHIDGGAHCWVRGVLITDCDLGVKFDNARNCTVRDVTLRHAKRTNPTGHHALWVSGRTQDCLFENFDIRTQFVHDVSVEGFANGNVFSLGRAVKLNLDHHRNGPHSNLFTEIHTADVSRLWESSGRGDRGPHTGAWETVWNVTYDGGKLPAAPKDWPYLNVVGVRGYAERKPSDAGTWVESGEVPVDPPNLYEAQRRARLRR